MQLSQVRAVITGGGSGMGRATAEALVAAGGKVCIVDFNEERCRETVAALGENAIYECADVADDVRASEIIRRAQETFGYINAVVTLAGLGSGTRVLPRGGGVFPIETFRRIIDINLIGTFNYISYGALAMSEAPANEDGERGVIVCCSSLASRCGQIGQAAYSASKGGVEAMILPIARELARCGIRINAIAPGLIATNLVSLESTMAAAQGKPAGPAKPNDAYAVDLMFPKRKGRPDEFASLALEIIRNTDMNGATYALDGAIRFSPKW